MNEHSGVATLSCDFRVKGVVLAAAEPTESPVNVVQQTNGGSEDSAQIAADTMENEIREIF